VPAAELVIDVFICGFSCKSSSNLNQDRAKYGDSIKTGRGSTGSTGAAALEMLKQLKPAMVIFENVKAFCNQTTDKFTGEVYPAQVWTFLNKMHEAGYNAHFKVLNTQDLLLPQRRHRVYIVGCRGDMAQECVDWTALEAEVKIPDALLSSAEANENAEATTPQMLCSAMLAAAFEESYRALIENADVLPLEEFINKTLPAEALAEGTCPKRVLDACLEKNPQLKEKGLMGFVEVRGSGKGFFDTGLNNMICVTPTSMVFVPQLGRLLSAEELCTFQGLLMTDFLPLQNCSATLKKDLAGNSFATATMLAASALAISLGHLGKPREDEILLNVEQPEAQPQDVQVPRPMAAAPLQPHQVTIVDIPCESVFQKQAIDLNELSEEEIAMFPRFP